MARNDKPAVGRHGINSSAEAAAKQGSSLQSGTITDSVISSENAKREKPHYGEMPPKSVGGIM